MNGEGWPLTATYRDGSGVQRPHEHHEPVGRPRRHGELQPVALHVAEPQDHGRHAVQQLPPRPEQAGGTTLPPGAVTRQRWRDAERVTKASTIQKTWGIFVEQSRRCAIACSSRPRSAPTRTARSARTSSACTIRRRASRGSSPMRISSRAASVFSAISNLQLRLANGASGVQPGPTRRASHVLGQFGEHQEHRPADRDVQRDRQRQPQAGAVDRVGSAASTRSCSTTAFSSTSRTTRASRTTR